MALRNDLIMQLRLPKTFIF